MTTSSSTAAARRPACPPGGSCGCDGGGPHPIVRVSFDELVRPLFGEVPDPFRDLLDVAVYVYIADRAAPRGDPTDRGFGKDWRRRLSFCIPVRQPDRWNDSALRLLLVGALSFLSEDEYDFRFEPLREEPPLQHRLKASGCAWEGAAEEVVLYSGGLDSTAGAVQEAVVNRRRALLVQHRPSPKAAPRQRGLLRQLRALADPTPPMLFPVRINKDKGLTHESTQRTRSFLFAALGAAVAAMVGLRRLRVYDNGVVSLNLPPSAQVVGARASRSTHPQALNGFAALFTRLAGRPFAAENLFLWSTKAEVVRGLAEAGCAGLIGLTHSCAHPRQARSQQPHCGRCSQCIDRRFAVLAARREGDDPADGYQVDLLTGPRPGRRPRTMLSAYVETASQITQMDSLRFFGRYGEAARALRHLPGDAEAVARQVFGLYQRHSREVMRVVAAAIARHALDLARRKLPTSCLIRLACDAAGAEGAAAPSAPAKKGGPRREPDYFFRQRGKLWEYRFAGGEPKILLSFTGGAYLGQLLSRPGVPVTAVELAYAVARDDRIRAAGDAGPALGETDLAAYRAMYEVAKLARQMAHEHNDPAAAEQADRTLSWLAEEMRKHRGLGGQPRKASDDRERVRKAVGNAVRRAVGQIAEDDPAFGEHLQPPRLTCGATLGYQPGDDLRWEF
jgi:hypothetical protein